ncbi:MAG: DUF5668 domain-containing protein [Treponema sp.]|nr:DUF5668 domain-containing protein [Treponema sp.]
MIFFIGLLLMLLGSAFLFGSLAEASTASVIVSFLFVLVGIGCAAFALVLNKRSMYLFVAALFLQIGVFLFLAALRIIPFEFSKTWPALSVFSGLALIPAGWRHYGQFRFQYLVPAIAFVVIGIVLFIFSLNLVSFSLSQFVLTWWPLLVLIAGLILILLALGTKNSGETKQ